jgi:cytochrome c-type biogenesis protein CcmH
MVPRLGPACLLLALAFACDRAIEPYVPGEEPTPPDLSRIFPEGADRSAEREERARMPAAPDTDVAAPIRGRIELSPELADRIPAGAILFLIARRGESGPPLAVQRIAEPKLPLDFSIGPDDRMIQQMPFAGPLRLSARLDADGNAMTRLPGDLQGSAASEVEPGASGVAIVIDQVL